MTPDDARVDINASQTTSSILVNVLSPQIYLNFFVPKADMRNPPEVPISEFISGFWTRAVHPEIFQIDMVRFFIQEVVSNRELFCKSVFYTIRNIF